MKTFLFFRGFVESPLLDIDWDAINRINNLNTIITPSWQGINYHPTWIVNPNYTHYIPPNYTITTTPGTGTYTISNYGTINTAVGFSSLTTSNTNGTTYTTTGTLNTLTTGTATYSSSSFKLY
jgi:hypothetical protein